MDPDKQEVADRQSALSRGLSTYYAYVIQLVQLRPDVSQELYDPIRYDGRIR